jgi:hypothetical protein
MRYLSAGSMNLLPHQQAEMVDQPDRMILARKMQGRALEMRRFDTS